MLSKHIETARQLLINRSVSIARISEETGISRATLYDLIADEPKWEPRISTLDAIFAFFKKKV